MGLLVYVYRTAAFEPDGNISDRVDRITVINIRGPFEPSPDTPAFRLDAHHWYPECPLLVPVEANGGMAGGNYAGTSDSRWSEAVRKITGNRACDLVPIHDRFEGSAR